MKRDDQRTFASPEAKLVLSEEQERLVWAYGAVYGDAVREVYRRCVVGTEAWVKSVRKELVARGWREDEADSIFDIVRGAQDAALSSTKLALDTARDALVHVEKRLDWAMRGNSKRRVGQRHGLARRRDILSCRVARLENRLSADDVRVFFGGRKLALAGNDPAAHGYSERAAWREVFDRARSNVVFLKGDKEASLGNSVAKVLLGERDVLRLRIPDLETKDGLVLRELSGAKEWVEIEVVGLSYRRGDLEAALCSAETAAEASARWDANRRVFEVLKGSPLRADAAATAHLRPPPSTPYKAKRAVKPVSVRLFFRERTKSWYLAASVEVADTMVLGPNRALRRRFPSVLGVDLNPDHLAWALVARDGNPCAWGRIPLDLSGTAAQNHDAIGVAVGELVKIAKRYGAPIAHELLDFQKSRSHLRYECSRRIARLLSSFAYSKFAATLASRCAREGVARVPVSPAWTSVLGQTNYAAVYGVSVDQGAACVIARRALGLATFLRPQVARQVPRSGSLGHTSRRSPTGDPSVHAGLKLVAGALPRRRSTWEPSGLCLRHSAASPGPPGKGEELSPAPALCSPTGPSPSEHSSGSKPVPCGDAVAAARTRAYAAPGERSPVLADNGQLRE